MSGLGRIYKGDPRDHLLRQRALAATPAVRRRSKRWPFGLRPINQGETGTCVGHGGKHFDLVRPVRRSTLHGEPSPIWLYSAAREKEGWDPKNLQDGAVVRDVFKVMQDLRWIDGYQAAESVDDMADWIAGLDEDDKPFGGPLLIGVNWYDSFDQPDDEGFVSLPATATIRGGHCVCVLARDEKRGYFEALQSWDWRTYGVLNPKTGLRNGRFRIPDAVMGRLLAEDGEAWAALEVAAPPA